MNFKNRVGISMIKIHNISYLKLFDKITKITPSIDILYLLVRVSSTSMIASVKGWEQQHVLFQF